MTIALADHARRRRGEAFVLIHTNPANQDDLLCVGDEAAAIHRIDPGQAATGSALADVISATPERMIIITGGSADLTTIHQSGAGRTRHANRIPVAFSTLLVIPDAQILPLELRELTRTEPDRLWLIGRSRSDRIDASHRDPAGYRSSDIDRNDPGYLTFPLPPAWAVRAMLFDHRSPADLLTTTPLFERIALEQWRNRCAEFFLPILGQPRRSRVPSGACAMP
ncbi:hypothetical protein [Acidiphilium sp.]|uniref:hypothetical protein n=1 Tax=Acidiphilium sp. TaxID=527 RepID=UPI003CFE1EF4